MDLVVEHLKDGNAVLPFVLRVCTPKVTHQPSQQPTMGKRKPQYNKHAVAGSNVVDDESKMKNAKARDRVEFKGLKGAAHLNGTRGSLIKYLKKENRWAVRCYAGAVKAKPENLTLLDTANVILDHPIVAEALGDTNVLSVVLGFLHWKEILRARVCTTWRDAARVTAVPESKTDDGWHVPELYVQNRNFAEALRWISDALPMVPSVNILFHLCKTEEFTVANGEGSSFASTGGVDISPIANFRHLRNLSICGPSLNGSYPYLFDFPNMRSLELADIGRLEWDLGALSGLPKLEKLRCVRNDNIAGSLKDIRVLRETLVELCFSMLVEIEGNLMDLADFPLLKNLKLIQCNKIDGDIRDIGLNDFQSIERMVLPDTVHGGGDLPSIAETPDIMHAWYILKKRNPQLFDGRRMSLSLNSPERYDNGVHHSREMPACVEFVKAGKRIGWRWTNAVAGGSCETNWLDPAPSASDEGYDVYLEELRNIEKDVGFYRGFVSPPTQEEHRERNAEIPLDPIFQMGRPRFF